MRTLEQLKELIKTGRARARSLKTKAAQRKAWDAVRDLDREACMILYGMRDAFATHSVKATVRYSTPGDDHVALSTPYGVLFGNPSSDVVSKSWYGHTCCVEYSEGQTVVVEIDVDVDTDRLCLFVIPKSIYGGTLNEQQYAELSLNPNLAFFKYPTGGMSGLFATNKSQGVK